MARPLPTAPDHLRPSRRVVWDAIEATMRERWEHTHLPDLGPKEVERAMLAPTTPMIGARETLARMMGRPVERGSGGRFDLPLDSDWTLEPDRPSYRDVTTGVWPVSETTTPLSTSPHWLEPPEGWQEYSVCEDELRGDERECKHWVEPRTMAEFWALPTSGTEDALTIEGATADEAAMLRKAWAVLMDSVELVRWSRCWYTGRSTAGDCMIRHIEGRSFNKTVIEVVDGVYPDDDSARMLAEFDDGILAWLTGRKGRITAYRDSSYWIQWLDVWMNAKPADRHCLSVNLATILAHELSHVCLAAGHVDGRRCEEAWLTGSSFQFAAFHQYPEALTSKCCSDNWLSLKSGLDLFGRDSGTDVAFGRTCSTIVSSSGTIDSTGVAPKHDSPVTDDKGRPAWPDRRRR